MLFSSLCYEFIGVFMSIQKEDKEKEKESERKDAKDLFSNSLIYNNCPIVRNVNNRLSSIVVIIILTNYY